ncbi:MAG: mitochondrial fission ELM1 family protein [Geminicoccaceae bacterium]
MQQPRIWALLDDRPGHQTQVKGLADRLGQPYETRTLLFNRLNRLPNPLVGASLLTVDQGSSEPLTPPFPDIVITTGRRCLPVARWIKRASGGRSKLIHIGRKGVTAADEFSLLISCAHFNMPPHAQRLAVMLPPTQVTEACLAKAKDAWQDLFAGRQQPNIVLLVGGETALNLFPTAYAVDLLRRAEAATRALGGSLTVLTSRRTSPDAIDAMQNVAEHAAFHLWNRQRERNPYLGYLAWADGLIVTGESESMLAEAAATGSPLHIAPLPLKQLSTMRRLRRQMTSTACAQQGGLASIYCALFNSGWMTPSRDLEKMHSLMYQAGLARPFEAELNLTLPAENRTSEQYIDSIAGILSGFSMPLAQT